MEVYIDMRDGQGEEFKRVGLFSDSLDSAVNTGDGRLPSSKRRINKEFKGFLDRQERLTEYLDDMFHVKQ